MKNIIIGVFILAANLSWAMTMEQGRALKNLVVTFHQLKAVPEESGLINFKADQDREGQMVIESEWESLKKLMDFAHQHSTHKKLRQVFSGGRAKFIVDHASLRALPKNMPVKAVNIFDPQTMVFELKVRLAQEQVDEQKGH